MARHNFDQTYQKLDLSELEITDILEARYPNQAQNKSNIDTLVQVVRQKVYGSVFRQCGTMRVLGMHQPIDLQEIYTNLNILKQINSRRRLEITDILQVSTSDEFERPGLGGIYEERVPGIAVVKQYPKLMVLGKPGAGKTTFLKHLAIQCLLGEVKSHSVPFFISLKDFAETEPYTSLLEYITRELTNCNISNSSRVAKQLLKQGRAFILLDGLDEVVKLDPARILQEIRNFSKQFDSNSFVVTCRIAAREYAFENFIEVEIADFDDEQITIFVNRWFLNIDAIQSHRFIHKLKQNHPIQELATNPLLLTLLCLTFEELADFPANRLELYNEGLNLLLKKWDAIRNIQRDEFYKKLSVQQKQDLLSKIALTTFEQSRYFFKYQELEDYIIEYLKNLCTTQNKIEALKIESSAVIKSIEVQHGLLVERATGIYSFSHLTFHEYFAAKEIVTNSDPRTLDAALQQLVSRVTEKRWREVFLLTVGMLRNANYVLQLLKQQIDNLVVEDQHLQNFLIWLNHKALTTNVTYKVVAIRAFYLELVLGIDLKIHPAVSLALKLDPTLSLTLKRDLELDLELNFALSLTYNLDFTLAPALSLSLERALSLCLDPELKRLLYALKEQLPKLHQSENSFKKWWKANGIVWIEQLRFVQIQYRNISHSWQFSSQQKQILQQYYDANKLLWDCMNSASYMTQVVRRELEETLLLPFAEIEQRKKCED